MTTLLKRRQIFVGLINFVYCFIHMYLKSHIWSWHFFTYACFWQNTELDVKNQGKIPQLNLFIRRWFKTFYHIVFLEVSKSYGVIPNDLKIKKDACIGNASKNFVTTWDQELSKAEIQLLEDLILEHVRKLYATEEKNFDSLF